MDNETGVRPEVKVEPIGSADRIFADPRPASDFEFGAETAGVFDDMVGRSVPYYDEIQRMIGELAADFATEGSNLYDLGCSTGTTLAMLDPLLTPGVHFVGVDNSAAMLAQAKKKLASCGVTRPVDLQLADLHEGPAIENASVTLLVLTLQFIRPLYRERLVRRIAQGTNENGCLILVEKLTTENTLLNRLFIKHYYDMKRRKGYSDLEIAQKREALENVLIPYRPQENRALLLDNGFRHVEEFFRWYNFDAMIAVK
ncbi:MAG: carboxy-S-adenosyl-L-methionine synthase CmoA [Rhodospirillales bacterium]|nr:carboxy-S-adenosyl-L-methionine synthase CmoA [Rhodospirillales bacterium]